MMIDRNLQCNDQLDIAFLLMIHNNPTQVNMFIRQLLTYEHSYVYIHVDEKGLAIIPKLYQSDRIVVLPKHFNCQWGDYLQVQVGKYLVEYAHKCRHHDYYSLHSGADLAIKPVNEFVEYLRKTNYYGYYGCTKLPNGWQYGGGLGRIALKWPRKFKVRVNHISLIRFLRSLYGRLYGAGIIRGRKLPEKYSYFGGDAWFTIRDDCAEDFINFIARESEYEDLFVKALSGDEIYYVSIFQMTKGDRETSDKNALRYIDWKDRGQKVGVGSPNIMAMDFLNEIEEAEDKFFARKFDSNYDSEIIHYFLDKTGVID